jgi:peroxiredoxin
MPLLPALRDVPGRLASAWLLVLAVICLTTLAACERTAPEVVFSTLSGQKVPLQSLRGKIVLVNFWATSCAPCVHEMPQLAGIYRQLNARGLEIVAVAAVYDPPNAVLDFATTRRLPFPVALDIQDEVAQAFGGIKAVPTTYLVGRDGKIIEHFEGELEAADLRRLLEEALAE